MELVINTELIAVVLFCFERLSLRNGTIPFVAAFLLLRFWREFQVALKLGVLFLYIILGNLASSPKR